MVFIFGTMDAHYVQTTRKVPDNCFGIGVKGQGQNEMCLTRMELSKENISDQVTNLIPGRVAQWVTCLATDACLTADPGVASLIPARYHTFVEIDHEIISTVILLPSADSFKKGCCQLQAKVCAQITG